MNEIFRFLIVIIVGGLWMFYTDYTLRRIFNKPLWWKKRKELGVKE